MKTIESNKLIAEFMGWENICLKTKSRKLMVSPIHGHFDDNFPNNLIFHSSWDWLIPVIEKIESLGYDCSITSHSTGIIGVKYARKARGNTSRLERTYSAVIEFIKWYNENK